MEDVDLFNNSSLGWAQSPLSAVQSCSKHHIRINSCSPVFPASRPHTRTSSHNPVLSVGRHHAWTSSCSSFNPEETARLTNQEAAGTSQAVLWRVSLHCGVTTCGSQHNYVRLTNPRSSLAKKGKAEQNKPNAQGLSPTVCGVTFILLDHRSFHVSATAEHPFPCVCGRKTFFQMSV